MLATKTDGTLWSWGTNTGGVLGQNNGTQYNSPKQIGTDTTWNTPGDRKFDAEYLVSGAIKTDGTLWVWGNGNQGAMGNNNSGPTANQSSPIQIPGTWDTFDGNRECAYATKSYT